MGHWNYRVCKRVDAAGEILYGVHEVYYNDDGSFRAATELPVPLEENAPGELTETIARVVLASSKPVVDITNPDELKELEWSSS